MSRHDTFVRSEWGKFLSRDLRGGVVHFRDAVDRVGGISEAVDLGDSVRFMLSWCAAKTAAGFSRRSNTHITVKKTRFLNSASSNVIKFGSTEVHLGDAVTVTIEMIQTPPTRTERRRSKKEQDPNPGPLFSEAARK